MITKMTDTERHEAQHKHLAEKREQIGRIEELAFQRARRNKVRGARQLAHRASHSQRVMEIAGWRSHLIGLHGVPAYGPKSLGPFVGLDELRKLHDELHAEDVS